MPVIPSTQEAEAGETLEPGRQRLQVSQDRTTEVQPGRQSKTLSQKNPQTKPKPKQQKKQRASKQPDLVERVSGVSKDLSSIHSFNPCLLRSCSTQSIADLYEG